MNVHVNDLNQRLHAERAAALATPIDFRELEHVGLLKRAEDGGYVSRPFAAAHTRCRW